MPDEDKVKGIVGRVLRGLPADIEEPQKKERTSPRMCVECNLYPMGEKGSQAYEEGLCVQCATWKRRQGHWHTPPIPGSE